MAYPGSFLRVNLVGALYGTEEWSVGLSMANASPIVQPKTTADFAPYVAAAKAWMARSVSLIGGAATLETVKANVIGTNGKYLSGAQSYEGMVLPIQGGTAPNCAPQLTVAVTLETDRTRGNGARGRIFPPLVAPAVGADGRIADEAARGIGQSMAGLIDDLNNIGNGVVVVASPGGIRDPQGRFTAVKKITVGRVVDTQRRRRGSLADSPRAFSSVQPATPAAGWGEFGGAGFGGSF